MSELREVRPCAEHAIRTQTEFRKHVEEHIQSHGDNIASYAIVSWDRRGVASTSMGYDIGPIGSSFVPMFVQMALTTRLAREDAEIIVLEPEGDPAS
jgi:hypothetical protein